MIIILKDFAQITLLPVLTCTITDFATARYSIGASLRPCPSRSE